MAGKSNTVRREREKRPGPLEVVAEAPKLDRLVHERLRLGILSEAVLMGAGIAAIFIVRSVSRLWILPRNPGGDPALANGTQ